MSKSIIKSLVIAIGLTALSLITGTRNINRLIECFFFVFLIGVGFGVLPKMFFPKKTNVVVVVMVLLSPFLIFAAIVGSDLCGEYYMISIPLVALAIGGIVWWENQREERAALLRQRRDELQEAKRAINRIGFVRKNTSIYLLAEKNLRSRYYKQLMRLHNELLYLEYNSDLTEAMRIADKQINTNDDFYLAIKKLRQCISDEEERINREIGKASPNI